MRIEDLIDRYTRDKLNRMRSSDKNKSKIDEKLSKQELDVLMGINRPRYKRCRGAYRQR